MGDEEKPLETPAFKERVEDKQPVEEIEKVWLERQESIANKLAFSLLQEEVQCPASLFCPYERQKLD